VSQFDIDKEQEDITKITDAFRKLKKKIENFYIMQKCVWKFSETFPLHRSLLRVQLVFKLNNFHVIRHG